jgi:hypothetical protein
MFPGIKIGIGKGGGAVALPTPDALFDTRTGLVISDSIGGLTANIGNFPMVYMPATAGTDYARFYTEMSAESEPASWTLFGLYKAFPFTTEERRGSISYPFKRTGTGQFYFRTTPTMVLSAPLNSPSLPAITWTEWQAIGYGHDGSDNTIKAIWNKIIKSAADNDAYGANDFTTLATQNVEYEKFYCRGFFGFNKLLSEAEINNIRLNGVFPSGNDMIVWPFLDIDDLLFQDHWDGVKRYKGKIISGISHGWSNETGIKAPTDPYSVRDSLLSGTYNLYHGYSRQGINVAPYKTDGTKGAGAEDGDIEFPASNCLHNMAESLIDFSVITDATIKAFFNKADRTYWKSTIESTTDYALGAYLWHPYQLQRDFIELYAETGHENHIYASLRTSGLIVTGITALRIYKTNLS